MFGKKLLIYVKKPSQYNLRKIRSIEERKKAIEDKLLVSHSLTVSPTNRQYSQAYELVLKDKENQMMKFQNSVLFSPVYTPKIFKYLFVIPAFMVFLFLVYLRYITYPKLLLQYKKKYGISLKKWQEKGWMAGWLDEYNKKDQVLAFEAYSIQDLQVMYRQGLLKGGSKQQQQYQKDRAQKRKSKFVKGSKQFVLKDFKST